MGSTAHRVATPPHTIITRTACLGTWVADALFGHEVRRLEINKGRVDLIMDHLTSTPKMPTTEVVRFMEESGMIATDNPIANTPGLLYQQCTRPWFNDIEEGHEPQLIFMDSLSELTDKRFNYTCQQGNYDFCCNYSDLSDRGHLLTKCLGMLDHPTELLWQYDRFFHFMINRFKVPIIFIHFPGCLEKRPEYQRQHLIIRAAMNLLAPKYNIQNIDADESEVEHFDNNHYHFSDRTVQNLASKVKWPPSPARLEVKFTPVRTAAIREMVHTCEKLDASLAIPSDAPNGESEFCIVTAHARTIDYSNPDPREIDINDIALSLSREQRFVNQLRCEYPVALHACYVYDEVCKRTDDPSIRFLALHHDSPEAYMHDLPSPFKRLLDSIHPGIIKDIETRLLAAIFARYDIPMPPDGSIVKLVDQEMYFRESIQIRSPQSLAICRHSQEAMRTHPDGYEDIDLLIDALRPEDAESSFLLRHQACLEYFTRYVAE